MPVILVEDDWQTLRANAARRRAEELTPEDSGYLSDRKRRSQLRDGNEMGGLRGGRGGQTKVIWGRQPLSRG